MEQPSRSCSVTAPRVPFPLLVTSQGRVEEDVGSRGLDRRCGDVGHLVVVEFEPTLLGWVPAVRRVMAAIQAPIVVLCVGTKWSHSPLSMTSITIIITTTKTYHVQLSCCGQTTMKTENDPEQ